ncbi:MAG: PstS family phosphate ABC transporter substrate-binding protein [Clostridium sp.]|uniref:PstS family phosphate ABC transporter substrate-binding protein n=1 Tax=Clostridium sp. TaxID=1506 RepID=UPI003F308D68
MINKKMKVIVIFLCIAILGIVYLAFNAKKYRDDGSVRSITISGSTALLPLMEESIEGFDKIYSGNIINVQAGGSGTGLTQVLEGTVNIGNSDMFAEQKLSKVQASELVDHRIVGEGFCLITSKGSGVTNLTLGQIRGIFSGEIVNWKDVGGNDEPILVIHRPASSGTRDTFTNTILGGNRDLENDAIGAIQDSNGAVLQAMKRSPGAVSYMALTYMNNNEAKENLKIVKIEGYGPSIENIESGKYKFWSWGHMYTKGKAVGLSAEFIQYVMSNKNVETVKKLGFIPIQNIKNE